MFLPYIAFMTSISCFIVSRPLSPSLDSSMYMFLSAYKSPADVITRDTEPEPPSPSFSSSMYETPFTCRTDVDTFLDFLCGFHAVVCGTI